MLLPPVPRIIVIGDLHGDTASLCTCLYMTNIINKNMEWIAQPPNTIVVQLGDQLDSQTRNIEAGDWEKLEDTVLMRFTEKLDTVAKAKGGRFISMTGNHEIMNIIGDYTYVSSLSMEKSGGLSGRQEKFRPDGVYARVLAKRPCVLKIGNLLFCHAGVLPYHLDLVNNNLNKINEIHEMFCLRKPMNEHNISLHKELFVDQTSLLWNRLYVQGDTAIMQNLLDDVLKRTDCVAMIIGHNTISHITNLYNKKLWITDVGLSRAFATNNIEVLEILNGNTFNVITLKK